MKKIMIAITILIFSYLIIFTVIHLFGPKQQNILSAEKGVLDLSEWNFTNDGKMPLNGEWEFYPYMLLDAGDFKPMEKHGLTPRYVQVPAIWTAYDIDGQSMSAYGEATYRLKIKIDDGEGKVFGLKTSVIRMSNRIFVNGEIIGNSGEPGEKDVYTPANTPYVVYLTLQNGINEIIIQVANYDFLAGGGIINSIYLGDQHHISQLRDKSLMHDWVQSSVFIIMGLFFAGLYSQRKKDLLLLFFSIYCLCAGLYTVVIGEKVWYMVFPETPYGLFLRIQTISTVLANISLYLFIFTAFKNIVSKWIVMMAVTIGSLILIYFILFPHYIPLWMLILTSVYFGVASVYSAYVMIKCALEKMEGSVYMIIGTIAMTNYYIKYNMLEYGIMHGDTLVTLFPIESFVFLIMFALLMSLQFSNAFKRNEQLSKELLEVDKVKDEFLAKTSHELKTPLHGIINISSFLLDEKDAGISIKQKENLSLIHDTSMKLSNLVNDLIDVTRLKNGEFRLHLTKVDLKVSTQIVFDVLTFEIQGKQIQLMNEIGEVALVIADENRIRQILYNLIQNAIKHTEIGKIIVSSKLMDDKIYFYVEDTGTGIPIEKQEEIFGYFEQLDQMSPQDGYQSMGLGLYISRQLIEKMNGEIWVDWSEVGKGTRFGFTLPRADQSEQIAGRELIPQVNTVVSSNHDFDLVKQHEHTILIVDDEPSNIQILLNLLSKYEYNVITAFSAKGALRKLEKYKQIDLAILDVMMPEMSGIELCQKIRGTHSLLELPVLFATVKDLPEDIELGFKAGANDYITKPFDSKTILARIQTLLSMKSSMEEAFHNELAFLQAQIKPHFLHNALSVIVSFCYTNIEEAIRLLSMLNQYLRIIYNTDHTTMYVPLKRELQLVQAYVEIEKARFNWFEFSNDIDINLEDIHVPSLCIQPFIENAIRHGLFHKKGQGLVQLIIRNQKETIRVIIEDNGVGIPDEVIQQFEKDELGNGGIGMSNIKKRLDAMNGSIYVESKIGKGTKITIELPNNRGLNEK
ncbi:ATP-binding protein [Chengkuizengella sediminis]|uniref:ATP-binding protein n=1 Tax=Chengkuizengella sediminis TaxID=1885917 RepID=UPI00138A4582|nr:ATP-binding protein [Chengkuizengella sediminis]NDI34411.1 response regulator [Chengkuizengella sediminis]